MKPVNAMGLTFQKYWQIESKLKNIFQKEEEWHLASVESSASSEDVVAAKKTWKWECTSYCDLWRICQHRSDKL